MLKAYITNLGKYSEGELVGEWLQFPATEEEIAAVLKRIGIGKEYEEYFVTDYAAEINLELGEFEILESLNEIAEKLEEYDPDTLNAAAQVWGIKEVLEHDHDSYMLLDGVTTEEELGYYYAEVSGLLYNVPETVASYFDYEAYGRDISIGANGDFTDLGWIERIA